MEGGAEAAFLGRVKGPRVGDDAFGAGVGVKGDGARNMVGGGRHARLGVGCRRGVIE